MLLEERMKGLPQTYEPARNWQELLASADQVYYYNSEDGTSSWEMPPEYQVFARELASVDELYNQLKADMSQIDVVASLYVCPLLATHNRDLRFLTQLGYAPSSRKS